MNILDQNINLTTQKLEELWKKLVIRVHKVRMKYLRGDLPAARKAVQKFANLYREYNRFHKHLIYQMATYNLFGTHLRKIIAYLGIANDFFRILHYYKAFFNFLLANALPPQQAIFVKQQWAKLIMNEEKIRALFFNPEKTKILLFLENAKTKIDPWKHDLTTAVALLDELKILVHNGHITPVLVFLENIRGLNRIFGHLLATLEHLLLIFDFALFKRYQNEKILN